MEQHLFQVIVGNVGTVYDGDSEADARSSYASYVYLSEEVIGKPAGENVTLMFKGEPMLEYKGLRGFE